MDYATAVDATLHWIHLLAACLWVGGLLMTATVVQPVLRGRLEPGPRMEIYREIGRRFGALQWGCWAALGATGLVKLWRGGLLSRPFEGGFGHVLAVKLCLVGAMIALSLLHSQVWGPALVAARPGSPESGRLSRRMAFWGRVNAGLVVAIVACAALLRFNPW